MGSYGRDRDVKLASTAAIECAVAQIDSGRTGSVLQCHTSLRRRNRRRDRADRHVKATDRLKTDGLGAEVTTVVVWALFTTCGNVTLAILEIRVPQVARGDRVGPYRERGSTEAGLPLASKALVQAPSRRAGAVLEMTVPTGVATAGATEVTVTLNVTVWLNTDGFGDGRDRGRGPGLVHRLGHGALARVEISVASKAAR